MVRKEGRYRVKYQGEWIIGQWCSYPDLDSSWEAWVIPRESKPFGFSDEDFEEIDENRIIIGKKKEMWQPSFVGSICIGIESIIEESEGGTYSEIILNTILPETDNEYNEQKKVIEERMKLICDLYNNL